MAILYVTSREAVVTIVTRDGGRHLSDRSQTDLKARLDPARFLRLDASHLVNVEALSELVPWTHQRYQLVFADAANTELVLSRDMGRRLRAALGW